MEFTLEELAREHEDLIMSYHEEWFGMVEEINSNRDMAGMNELDPFEIFKLGRKIWEASYAEDYEKLREKYGVLTEN